MTAFHTTVRRHVDLDVTMVDAAGPLATGHASQLGEPLLSCAAECPSSLVVDLSRCEFETVGALAGLRGLGRAGATRPPVNIIVVGTDARLGAVGGIDALDGAVLFARHADAVASAAQHRSATENVRLSFQAEPAAPAQARDIVRAACQLWGTPAIGPNVELVASELVTNAVLYSGTAGALELINADDFLRLRVSDGSGDPPESYPGGMPPGGPAPLDHGRGLPLVSLLSAAWGYQIDVGGKSKAVWATFSRDSASSGR